MNNKMLKMVILQEKMNELCLIEMKNNPLCLFSEKLKNSDFFDNDLIDLLFANYYVMKKDNLYSKNIINFIEKYIDSKNILHDCFINNVELSNEIANSYLVGYYQQDNSIDNYNRCNGYEKQIVNKLSPIFNYFGINYLPFLTRCLIFEISTRVLPEMSNYRFINKYSININSSILYSILLSDSYTYMNLNNYFNEFNDYLYIIESNSNNINKLWEDLSNINKYLEKFLFFSSNLFLQDKSYLDIYEQISLKNLNFIHTLKKINPFYILDEIEDYNQKKYLIK